MDIATLPLGQIARDIPGATAVLHKLKLDFCCNGATPLKDAADKKGLDIKSIIASLQARSDQQGSETSLANATTEELIEHILDRFHDVHREQLPELIRLSKRVERVHGGRPECPAGLAAQLEAIMKRLEDHMSKEEQILFPMIARGVEGLAVAPVSVMREEHDGHKIALEQIYKITNNITLPEDACNTWTALYRGLSTFRDDLMEHIHLENNVLFNRIDGQMGGGHQH
jgi:regulator of cell morphogenesis and NO signaling